MELLERFIIYIIIIASNVDYSMLRPLQIDKNNEINETVVYQHNRRLDEDLINSNSGEHTQRQQRQVVQPEWLTDLENTNVFVDHRVHITDESLKEAAAIREAIQEAVDEGRYAIDDTNQSNHQRQPPAQSAPPGEQLKPAVPPVAPPTPAVPPAPSSSPDSPSFFIPPPAIQWQWNLHLPSNFAHFEPLFPAVAQQSDENAFVQEMQRMWGEFVENTRKMFSFN